MSARTDTFEVRIYYQDTDCGGVVYYGNYLRYFEQGRTHWLETRGSSVKAFKGAGKRFALVEAELDYLPPARFGATLTILTGLTAFPPAGVTVGPEIREDRGGGLGGSRC